MEKLGRELHSLAISDGGHHVPLSSSSAGGSSSAQLMLLRAAIDGDLRLFKEMLICLDKGQGEAATVAAVSYKGISVILMAVHMGRTVVLEYLERELGMDITAIISNTGQISEQLFSEGAYIDNIIQEIKSRFPQAQELESVCMPTPKLSWEDLHPDMVRQIACVFSSAEVYCKVKSVCRKWAAAVKGLPPSALHSTQIPYLLLPPLEPTKPYTTWKLRNRNSPADDALHLPHLSSAVGNVVVGSSFGWIIVLDLCFLSMYMLNPITGERITLPSLWSLYVESVDPSMLVQHAVLSSDPSRSNHWLILLFLITDNSSCFSYRYGSNMWTQHVHDECVVKDVVYFIDRFVALTEDNMLALFDVDSADPMEFVRFQIELSEGSRHLVLASEQELLLVTISDFDVPQVTPGHRPLIERLLISSRFVRREVLNPSAAIFLGHGCSVAVDLSKIPPSVDGGVFRTQTYLRLMGSRGSIRCGGVIRTSPQTTTSHDILHAQVFSSNDDLWLTWKPWWVTPNIFHSVPKLEQTQLYNRYTEIGSLDWCSPSKASLVGEKSWDNIHEAKGSQDSSGKQDQLSSQFVAKAQREAKKISEVHSEAEMKLALGLASTANMQNSQTGTGGPLSPQTFQINEPGTGSMMTGMPGVKKMPRMLGLDNDNWEVPYSKSRVDPLHSHPQMVNKPSSRNSRLLSQGSRALTSGKTSALVDNCGPMSRPSFAPAVTPYQTVGSPESLIPAPSLALVVEKPAVAPKPNSGGLQKKTISLLEEYFHISILDEAQQNIEELTSPDYYPEVVKEAINLALANGESAIDPLVRLLEHLRRKNIFKTEDLGTGCLLYGSLLDELAMDLPKAPSHFGEVIGRLILSRCLGIGVIEDTLKKMEDTFRSEVFKAATKTIEANPSGEAILNSHIAEIDACNNLLSSKQLP